MATGKKQRVRQKGYRVGETHHLAKLSDSDIDTIHYLSSAGLSHRQIAEKFDDGFTISKSTVRDILNGRIRSRRGGRIKR